jgi:hypothetical protein
MATKQITKYLFKKKCNSGTRQSGIYLSLRQLSILFSAYSQETTASADSGPSQKESNTIIKIITFSIIKMVSSFIVFCFYM